MRVLWEVKSALTLLCSGNTNRTKVSLFFLSCMTISAAQCCPLARCHA